MQSNVNVRVGFLLLVMSGSVARTASGHAQTPDPPPRSDPPPTPRTEAPATPPPTPEAPLKGPKYFNLRYEEDFSYLAGPPESYKADFFDPVKNIRFGEDMSLSLGGEFRFQMLAETNTAFGSRPKMQDTFEAYRFLLHFDWKYRKLARLFLQLGSMFDEERDLAPRPIDENRFTLHQLFLDVNVLGEDVPLTLRVGRQELQYGAQRLVSPLDWAAVRRRFDAVKLFWRDGPWALDFFYAKPVIVQREKFDDWNQDFDFYGAYLTYTGIPRHGLDVYFFAVDNRNDVTNPNGRSGDASRYTLGSRFWGKTAGFDYETEVAGQWGTWAGDTIQAWSGTFDGGYTFEAAPWKPRLGAGFDWATGDDDPRDDAVGTFDQLFPLGHAYFGFLDLVGRQNIMAANTGLTTWPVEKKLKTAATYHVFWLTENEDALYNSAGAPGRRDLEGNSGREVGHELDVTILWNLDVHQSILLGYSHFWDSDFIIETGESEDPDLFYVQYAFKF